MNGIFGHAGMECAIVKGHGLVRVQHVRDIA